MLAQRQISGRSRGLLLTLATGICVVSVLAFFSNLHFPAAYREYRLSLTHNQTSVVSPREAAANETLGFSKVFALSSGPSWRTRGLQAAAELTGLQISIPPQPPNPVEVVQAFQKIGNDKPGGNSKPLRFGSASAWLAHLDLLKFIVSSGVETAFVLEDDVDWDVRIKDQLRLVSDGVRAYKHTPAEDPSPFGTASGGWDVLWLGHCGSVIFPDTPTFEYADDTRCAWDRYWGWSKAYIEGADRPGFRKLQAPVQTVCSFGYGVTSSGAAKILSLSGRGGEAFDVFLSTQCSEGRLACVVANPEILHHYQPSAGHGYVSPVRAGDGKGIPGREDEFEHIMGTTSNILRSARCEALFGQTCLTPATPAWGY